MILSLEFFSYCAAICRSESVRLAAAKTFISAARTGSANQTNETTRNKNLFFMGVVFYSLAGFFNA
jgi:hypothetical protein